MRFRCFACMSVLSLAAPGCEVEESLPESSELVDVSEDALVVCAPEQVVYGIDVSYYQGNINWEAVASDGYSFAITRINHADFMDPQFDANWAGIKQVGLIRGAYQYFEPGDDPVAQANIVVEKVGKLGPGDLPVVIDVETTSGLTDKAAIVDSIAAWMDIVESGTGKKPIIYTGKYFWQDNVSSSDFADYPLWHAQYPNACQPPASAPPGCGSCANIADQWSDWLLWQYTSSGSVAGIAGNVDTNVFKGSYEDLVAYASQGGFGASVESLTAPKTVLASESFSVSIAVTNTGGTTWGSATKLATTEPRDRESLFADASWPANNRLAAVSAPVALGESYSFELTFVAPAEPGTYTEHFGLVEESVAWFGDQAGPPDNAIAFTFQVVADPTGAGGSTNGSGGEAGANGEGAGPDTSGNGGGDAQASASSCAVQTPASRSFAGLGWVSLLALAAAARRRRGSV